MDLRFDGGACIRIKRGRRRSGRRRQGARQRGMFLLFEHADCRHLSSVISGPHHVAGEPAAQKAERKEKTKGCDTPISILDRNSSPPAQLYLGRSPVREPS